MATALKYKDNNDHKKTFSVFASGDLDENSSTEETLFNVPPGSFIVKIDVVDIEGGGACSISGIGTGNYYPNGSEVRLTAAPGAGTKAKLLVQYIETELCTGERTV